MRLDMTEVTSRNARSDSELLVLAPIKAGFVEVSDTLSYASRLQRLLGLFFEFRRTLLDVNLSDAPQPIEMLRTISAVQWTVLEEERKLLVAVSFDRSFEAYFERLVDVTGPLLDALFIHCGGYDRHTCSDGFESFTNWLRQYQRRSDFLFTADSDLTLDDVRIFRKFAGGLSDALDQRDLELDEAAGKEEILSSVGRGRDALTQLLAAKPLQSELMEARQPVPLPSDLHAALCGVFELRRDFPRSEQIGLRDGSYKSAEQVFDDAARCLLAPVFIAAILTMERQRAQQQRAAGQTPDAVPTEKQIGANLGTTLAGPVGSHVLTEVLGLDQALRAWLVTIFEQRPASDAQASAKAAPPKIDTRQIQGNLLCAYPKVAHGRVLLLRCDHGTAARALLHLIEAHVGWQTEQRWAESDEVYCNFAITYEGLLRLGVADDTLRAFPKEFREGMERRAPLLGDIGYENHPRHWQRPTESQEAREISLYAVDFCLVLQCRDEQALLRKIAALAVEFRAADVRVIAEQSLRRTFQDNRVVDAFGLSSQAPADAESQPRPVARIGDTTFNGDAARIDQVALGELLLGHPDRHGNRAVCASEGPAAPLFKDGSFLVMRKLEQHVERFHDFVNANHEASGIDADRLKALVIGRNEAGVPLAAPEAVATDNQFDYEPDNTAQSRCPLHAHMRRSNPRLGGKQEPNATPRILRRSFAYEEQGARGLLFMAYNASIALQFEVIQSWVNGGNSTGLLSAQNDLLCGLTPTATPHDADKPPPSPWRYPYFAPAGDGDAQDLIRLRPPRENLVSLRWGMYLFVPSRRALHWLKENGKLNGVHASQSDVERGLALIRALDAMQASDPEAAKQEWKRMLEDPAFSASAQQIWAALRAQGLPSKETCYGRLVAGVQEARRILSDDGRTYSVREYDRRLRATMGPHYLGFDAFSDEYLQQARAANAALEHHIAGQTYAAATSAADALLDSLPASRVLPERREVHVRDDLAKRVVLELCTRWLGLPNDADYLERFIETSRYAFQPHPGRFTPGGGKGKLAIDPARQDLDVPIGKALSKHMPHRLPDSDGDPTTQALVGAVVGFAAPAVFAITSVLDQWIESGELGSLAELVRCTDGGTVLKPALLQALANRPAPPILYRTDTRDGALCVIGLGSVYYDAKARGPQIEPSPEAWLFGGPHRSADAPAAGQAPHGCPVREPALQILLATVSSLLRRKNLRRERRMVVSFCPSQQQARGLNR